MAWVGYTRHDALHAIDRAAQVTPKTFISEKIKTFNSTIRQLKASAGRCLFYSSVSKDSLHIRVYADASFAGNDDLSSQLGFIIRLCDSSHRAHVLECSSKKSKRIVRSVLEGEIYAFAEGFDRAFVLRHDLQTIFRRNISLHMFTDSLQMFDVVTKGSHTTEKRLTIDIVSARQSYNREEISQVGLVASENNIADGLTKEKPNDALNKLLDSGFDLNPVRKWIVRTPARSLL